MSVPILLTKLFIPPARPELVSRPQLIAQLNHGLYRKMSLVSAPAGFGKTTLVSAWVSKLQSEAATAQPSAIQIAWLSLDEDDNAPIRFLSHFIAALNRAEGRDAALGKEALAMLQSPQPPSVEVILASLINELFEVKDKLIFVLDDYHVIETPQIDEAVNYLLDHHPPQFHLVIATREDPHLPLARLRVQDQLTELRLADLRFNLSESVDFLNRTMGFSLSVEDVAALEARTEGWIAGLQMAAISLRGNSDINSFIKSFTGSHHFVLDYLVEEVLYQQSESVQGFLLETAVLERLSAPLCDALTGQESGQEILEMLQRTNLFIVPLDNERRWYRYHHLFAELLRQRLHQSAASEGWSVDELHLRASKWYEENDLVIEAFHHAAAANDIERAIRLVEGYEVSQHFAGMITPVLNWLASLPTTILDAKPSLWVMYASTLIRAGHWNSVEPKLKAAEKALLDTKTTDKTRDLIGQIAAIRASLAIRQEQVEPILIQARRALEYLHPDNLNVRTTTICAMGYAYQLQEDRAAARQAFAEALSNSQKLGDVIINILASIGLGNMQESENQLILAAENYRNTLQKAGDPPISAACEAPLGLARIHYEWNDLDTAKQYAQQSIYLGRQVDRVDTPAAGKMILARLKLAQGDVEGAATLLAQADQFVRQHNFVTLHPQVAAFQVMTRLRQGNLPAAAHLAEKHDLPLSVARVHLAQGEPAAALAVLGQYRQAVEAKDWKDEQLKVMILQAVASLKHGEKNIAVQRLGDALTLAEPGGFIRIFADEGEPMAQLLSEIAAQGVMPDYTEKLLAVVKAENQIDKSIFMPSPAAQSPAAQPLIENLSNRELDVLKLLKTELTGPEIANHLMVSLTTIRSHTQNIYRKLGVKNRRAAIIRAEELDLV